MKVEFGHGSNAAIVVTHEGQSTLGSLTFHERGWRNRIVSQVRMMQFFFPLPENTTDNIDVLFFFIGFTDIRGTSSCSSKGDFKHWSTMETVTFNC
jgi:hypothetical protein